MDCHFEEPRKLKPSDQLQMRATLFDDAWHHKFVHETNLVDVHMVDCVALGVAHGCAKCDGEQGMLTKR